MKKQSHERERDLNKAKTAILDEKPTPESREAVRRLLEQNRRERKGG